MSIAEAKLLHGLEQWPFFVIPQHWQMECGRVVVAMKVTERNKRELEHAKRMKVRDRLCDPELVVCDAAHDLVTNRCRCVVPAGGVEIPRHNQRISVITQVGQEGK